MYPFPTVSVATESLSKSLSHFLLVSLCVEFEIMLVFMISRISSTHVSSHRIQLYKKQYVCVYVSVDLMLMLINSSSLAGCSRVLRLQRRKSLRIFLSYFHAFGTPVGQINMELE